MMKDGKTRLVRKPSRTVAVPRAKAVEKVLKPKPVAAGSTPAKPPVK